MHSNAKIKRVIFVWITLLLICILAFTLRIWNLGLNPLAGDEFIGFNTAYGYLQTEERQWHEWNFNENVLEYRDVFPPRYERAWAFRWQIAFIFSHLYQEDTEFKEKQKEEELRLHAIKNNLYFNPSGDDSDGIEKKTPYNEPFFVNNEFIARSVSVFWGILTVFIIFWSARVFTGNIYIALFSAFLFAISISGIEFDRKIRMYAMFYPIFLMLSTLLFLFLESKPKSAHPNVISRISNFFGCNIFYLIPLIFVGLISFHLHLLTTNIIFPIFIYFLLIIILGFFLKNFSISQSALWGIIFIPLGYLYVYLFHTDIHNTFLSTVTIWIDNAEYFTRAFRDFEYPALGFFSTILGFLFISTTLKRPKQALWLFLSYAIPLILFMFAWNRTQGNQYIFFIQSFILILSASGVIGLAIWLAKKIHSKKEKYFAIAVVLIGSTLLLPCYSYFFEEYNTYNRDTDYVADYREVFNFIEEKRRDEDALITRNFRNYYFRNWGANVLDFGGERATEDLSKEDIFKFICTNKKGWVIIFDRDTNYIQKEAVTYIEENFQRTPSSHIQGASKVFQWKPDMQLCVQDIAPSLNNN